MQGKVVIVTGASRGIGKAIAKELARKGASIIINFSRDIEGAEETLKEIIAEGGYAKIIQKDISKVEGCRELINETIGLFGKVDVLVNNAGISKLGMFMDSSVEEINDLMNCNLLAPIYLSKEVLPHMISKGQGNIINISSIWGEAGASYEVLYSASKGGINTFTKALAKEVAPMGIRVNGIAPGVIETGMNNFLSKEEKEALCEEIPMGRFGLTEEIGKAVVFLCNEECSYITGQIIKIDGGMI